MSRRDSSDPRFRLSLQKGELSPLSHIEAYIGTMTAKVLNISHGGMALILEAPVSFKLGDFLDVSVSLKGRAFPVQVEIKAISNIRMSCQFHNESALFSAALKEFLAPKYLAMDMQERGDLRGHGEILSLEEGAKDVRIFSNQNEMAFFVWLGEEHKVMRLFGAWREAIVDWRPAHGFRTGRIEEKNIFEQIPDADAITWDHEARDSFLVYFKEILLEWISGERGIAVMKKLNAKVEVKEEDLFPPASEHVN